jgi:L-ascorbate metabolism protein UlaG (beta-lactamase superfamily)
MEASLEFIGTATTLLRFGPFTLLTDPNFLHSGQRVYLGKGLFSKRQTEPSLQPADLPPLDAVLLSHLHGDHFDRVARDRLPRDLPVLTTPAASDRLRRWGFADARGMSTWEAAELTAGSARLTVTAVPGQHGPGPARHLMPPVQGEVVEHDAGDGSPPFRVYVTGDTLRRPWLREVTDRLGPLDAMVIHLGGTRALGLLVTMDAEQGADVVEMLRPAVTVPVHFDDYTVFRSPLGDFLDECERRGAPSQVLTVVRGDRIPLTAR